MTSIRANATQLGIPDPSSPTQITAFVSVTGPTTIPTTNNVLSLGVPMLGLTGETSAKTLGLQCEDTSLQGAVHLEEGFAGAFRTVGEPSFYPADSVTESGYFAPGSNLGGGASQATRVLLRFFNVPAGVQLAIPKRIQNGEVILQWVSGADADGAGGVVSSESDDLVIESPRDGLASVLYEVVSASPYAVEGVDVPIAVSWTADAPDVGAMQVQANLAPLSAVVNASLAAPEPRFVDNGSPQTIFAMTACSNSLLFPYVTNQAGEESRPSRS